MKMEENSLKISLAWLLYLEKQCINLASKIILNFIGIQQCQMSRIKNKKTVIASNLQQRNHNKAYNHNLKHTLSPSFRKIHSRSISAKLSRKFFHKLQFVYVLSK